MVKLTILRQHWGVRSGELVTIVCFPLALASNSMTTGNNVFCVNIFFIIRVSSYRKGYFILPYICSSIPWSIRKSWGRVEVNSWQCHLIQSVSVRFVSVFLLATRIIRQEVHDSEFCANFFSRFFARILCDRTSGCCLYFPKPWSHENDEKIQDAWRTTL